jgi:hypothetical protein
MHKGTEIVRLLLCSPLLALAAFDPGNNERNQQLSPSMQIFWTLNSSSIALAMQVVKVNLSHSDIS